MVFNHIKALGFWATRISSAIKTMVDKEAEPHGLTFSDVIIIMFLSITGPQSLVELSRKMAFAHPSVLRKIDSLEENGILERKPHPEDRRIKLISLTRKGEKLGPLVQGILLKVNQKSRNGFTENEYEQLINMLIRAYKNVAPQDDLIVEIMEKPDKFNQKHISDLFKL